MLHDWPGVYLNLTLSMPGEEKLLMFTIAPFTIYAFLGWEKIGDGREDLDLDWVRVWSRWPRGMGEIIPNPHFRFIFTSVFLGFTPPSYPFINATVRIPVTQFWWICTKVSFPVSKVHPWMGKIGLNTFLFYWVIWLPRDPLHGCGSLPWYSLKI